MSYKDVQLLITLSLTKKSKKVWFQILSKVTKFDMLCYVGTGGVDSRLQDQSRKMSAF